MSTEGQYGSSPPLPPDESYWEALLNEGEIAINEGEDRQNDEIWDDYLSCERGDHGDEVQDENFGGLRIDWEQVQRAFEADTTLELHVVGYNRGGLLVEWGGLRGFVPASQLVDFPSVNEHYDRRDVLAVRVGTSVKLRVLEMDRELNRLILSERAAQVEPGTRASVLNTIHSGDICTGHVTNLCEFGVFVDLGGIEGLIHISELSWGRVGHPADILERGDTIRVYVMQVDPHQERVALSLKRLHPDPWKTVENRYAVGQVVEGVITNVVDFGAFVCLEEGLEGLIHVSELAEGHFLHPRNVVCEGETVRARVLNIDGDARRLGLSLRQPG